MAFFYVKNSLGTRTSGGGLTQQTGSFADLGASNVYATINAALSDGAGDGDVICVSDAHAYTKTGQYESDARITYAGPTAGGTWLTLISVSDSACDVYAKATAAQETSSPTNPPGWITLAGYLRVYGVYLAADFFEDQGEVPEGAFFYECTFTGSFVLDGGYSYTRMDKCSIGGPIAASHRTILYSGAITSASEGVLNPSPSSKVGPTGLAGRILLDGVDLSVVTDYLVKGAPSSSSLYVRIRNCYLASGVAVLENPVQRPGHEVVVSGSANTAAVAEYQYFYANYYGTAEHDAAVYRQGSTPFNSGARVSLKATTTANASPSQPFKVELPSTYALLAGATAIRLYVASTAALTDADVQLVGVYDADGSVQRHYVASAQNAVLRAGTALDADTGSDWRDGASELSGYNEYVIELDLSGNAGREGVPTLYVTVLAPSTTVHIDPVVEVS